MRKLLIIAVLMIPILALAGCSVFTSEFRQTRAQDTAADPVSR